MLADMARNHWPSLVWIGTTLVTFGIVRAACGA